MVILAIAAACLSIPVAVLLIEVLGALRPQQREDFEGDRAATAMRAAVIVPAHNESVGLIPTLDDVKSQLGADDRLVVVADNCTDDTATVAAAAGAEVLVRNDPARIGKGYAMGWALDHLKSSPPDAVLFVDADCRIEPGLLQQLKTASLRSGRPVQALFLMRSPEHSPINHSLAEFAWILKNQVRPLGLRSFNCPVQLMGTGMMFPWSVISTASLGGSHLVEDMKLGLDLAAMGRAPQFFPFGTVTSEFPMTVRGTESQRQRWVQGHLGTIWKSVPGLLWRSVFGRNRHLLVMTLDVLVPPLSLLALLIVAIFAVAICAAFFTDSWTAALIASANLMAFTFAIALAWRNYAHEVFRPSEILALGSFAFEKFMFYVRLLLGRTASQWIRTDRAKS